MTRSIETLRQALDVIDAELLDHLAARQVVVDQIGLVKRAHRESVRDERRERSQRARMRRLAEVQGLAPDAVDALWDAILSQSRARQTAGPPLGTLTVAIQGGAGSWSALALDEHLGDIAAALPCGTFRDALTALRSGRAQLALVPVHNAIIGPVEPAARMVRSPDLVCLAELSRPIRHCLATSARVELAELTHVHSQAPALAQCAATLDARGLVRVEEEDTARAADVVRALEDPRHAVLCSPQAAEARGLVVVARDVADGEDNHTTWALVARRPGERGPYRLGARLGRPDHVVRVGDVAIGGSEAVVMAGPCSVESPSQLREAAVAVELAGGRILRGGAFKPRTSPWSFQGLGLEGLELLARVGAELGLPVVTEVMEVALVPEVARYADILQIGARNMQNTPLLQAVGRTSRPVLLKRGPCATVDEWLGAADYILAEGNEDVILCERGIRTFARATRNTLDLSVVPVLRERTHLPVIVDPSHAVGVARWIPDLAVAAIAAGAHGIIVEVHPDPPSALSDAAQALTPEAFAKLMDRVRTVQVATRGGR